MHGLGNDYVYVDCIVQSLHGVDLPQLARKISDRHRGVGSDGLILIARPTDGSNADVRMEMYNADGSRGEMCGNGIRCVAKYAVEHGMARAAAAIGGPSPPLLSELNIAVGGFLGDTLALNQIEAVDLAVETDRGVLTLTAFTSNGLVRSVRVDMGEPILEPARVPVQLPRKHDGPMVRFPMDKYVPLKPPARWMEDCGVDLHMTCVSMGNPHVVIFCDFVDAVPLATIGPFIERQEIFPNRINVHFVQPMSRTELRMRTWERGAGITQACGTGACAVVVAAVLEERIERNALVHLPGGDLKVEWAESGHVFMTGPAEEVFSGEWEIGRLRS